jgi:hypothetical protein
MLFLNMVCLTVASTSDDDDDGFSANIMTNKIGGEGNSFFDFGSEDEDGESGAVADGKAPKRKVTPKRKAAPTMETDDLCPDSSLNVRKSEEEKHNGLKCLCSGKPGL